MVSMEFQTSERETFFYQHDNTATVDKNVCETTQQLQIGNHGFS